MIPSPNLIRPPATVSTGRRRTAGFTLIEALLAALLLVVGAGSLARAVSAATAAGRAAADTGLAARLAQSRMDRLQAARLSGGWLSSGYHDAVAPGGSLGFDTPPTPGYVEYFDREGAPSAHQGAMYEVRWKIGELVGGGSDRLAALRFDVAAGPAHGGRGAVVRLTSVRVANRE